MKSADDEFYKYLDSLDDESLVKYLQFEKEKCELIKSLDASLAVVRPEKCSANTASTTELLRAAEMMREAGERFTRRNPDWERDFRRFIAGMEMIISQLVGLAKRKGELQ